MSRQIERHIPHRCSIVRMTPHIIYRILPPSPYGPALREVEKHPLRCIQCVQDHEYHAVAAIARPVLRRKARVRDIVGINTPPEGRDTLAPMRILIDLDKILVLEDLNVRLQVRITRIRQVRANNERRLEQGPSREMALRFLVRQVPHRRALAGIAHLHDVEVVAAVEVRRPVRETRLVDDGRDAAPPRLDVAVDAPRLPEPMAPDPDLLPAPVAQREFERFGMRAVRECGDGVAHALVAAELVRLRDVVKGAVAVVVFDVVEAPFGPGREVLDLVAEGAWVAGARLVAVV